MVKSPIKIIDSGTVPTTENLGEGQIAFGTVDGATKLYGSDGTTVSELGGGGTQINNIDPLITEGILPNAHGHSQAVAIGYNASANDDGDIAILGNARGRFNGGYYAIAIGRDASAGQRGIALAGKATNFSIAIGSSSSSAQQSIAIGVRADATANNSVAVGNQATATALRSVAVGFLAGATADNSVSIGAHSSATEEGVVSVGSGVTALTLSDDMTEKQQAAARAAYNVSTRRIVNVTDPINAQDAATKKYVDDTVAGKADTSALDNYATKTELGAKANQTTVDSLTTTVNGKVSSVTAGEGISITGTATAPVINGMIAVPDWANPVSLSPTSSGGDTFFYVNPVPNTGVVLFEMAQRGSISINDTTVYDWAMTQDGQQFIFPVAAGDNLRLSFDLGGVPSTIKLFPYKFVEIS